MNVQRFARCNIGRNVEHTLLGQILIPDINGSFDVKWDEEMAFNKLCISVALNLEESLAPVHWEWREGAKHYPNQNGFIMYPFCTDVNDFTGYTATRNQTNWV